MSRRSKSRLPTSGCSSMSLEISCKVLLQSSSFRMGRISIVLSSVWSVIAKVVYGHGVNRIVSGMGSKKFHVDYSGRKKDMHDQAVMIAFDVEDKAIVREDTYAWEPILKLLWASPVSPLCLL